MAAWKILYTALHCSPLHYCPDAHDGCALECRAVSLSSAAPLRLSLIHFHDQAEQLLISLSSPQSFVHIRHRLERVPDQRGKTAALGLDYSGKRVLAEFHLYSLPLSHHVCVFFLSVCVVLSHSALTQILSYLRAAERQLNEGKVKSMDERANDTFSNMTLWTEEVSRLYKLCSVESVDCQMERKIKARPPSTNNYL